MPMPRFNITLWPAGRLMVPRVRPVEVRAMTGPVVRLRSYQDTEELPDEAYLRELFDLDLSSPEAIAAFARSWGWLGDEDSGLRQEEGQGAEVDDGEGHSVDVWEEGPLLASLPIAHEVGFENFGFLERMASELVDAGYLDETSGDLRHLDEFRLYAFFLRDAVRVFQAIAGMRDWPEVFSRWETPKEWFSVPFDLVDSPASREGAARFLRALVNGGLSSFQVHVDLHTSDPSGTARPWEEASLFSALCLQLANHMGQNATFHVCANETCGRYFVHQRGMAKYRQNRESGVRFCSPTCARAQAQREYRRRKKGGKSA